VYEPAKGMKPFSGLTSGSPAAAREVQEAVPVEPDAWVVAAVLVPAVAGAANRAGIASAAAAATPTIVFRAVLRILVHLSDGVVAAWSSSGECAYCGRIRVPGAWGATSGGRRAPRV